ncbi:MAG: ATP-binding cassette domain-containing protein [Pseudomonadota bacterium]
MRPAPHTAPGLTARRPVVTLAIDGMAYGRAAILAPLSLALYPREVVALTGPSGAGKTTLLRIIAGLESRFEGTLTAPARRAMVFQEPTLLPWRSARKNLEIACGLSPAAADDALETVGLPGLGARYPGQLSLGQQRRLSLARAFASAPDLMLLDEPFVSLDGETAESIEALFLSLTKTADFPTLLVTHDPGEAARLASRTLTLSGAPARIEGQ